MSLNVEKERAMFLYPPRRKVQKQHLFAYGIFERSLILRALLWSVSESRAAWLSASSFMVANGTSRSSSIMSWENEGKESCGKSMTDKIGRGREKKKLIGIGGWVWEWELTHRRFPNEAKCFKERGTWEHSGYKQSMYSIKDFLEVIDRLQCYTPFYRYIYMLWQSVTGEVTKAVRSFCFRSPVRTSGF